MEIKTKLNKPYTDKQRIDFIIEQNHNRGYEIRKSDTAIEAWGYTDDEILVRAKEAKKSETLQKANEYIANDAVFEFEEGKHIEATDGNIAKMTAYALAFVTGKLAPSDVVVWNTKEDETVNLTQTQILQIIEGIGGVQAEIWAVKFPKYLELIEKAQTIEEVKNIIINYRSDSMEETK